MSSFYGGKDGHSFIITKNFSSIADMNNEFNKSSSSVNYDEYVLIETKDRNNIENGRIYKRGYEGAEYIGRILGPDGPAPFLEFENFTKIEENIENLNDSYGTVEEAIIALNNNSLIDKKHIIGVIVNNQVEYFMYYISSWQLLSELKEFSTESLYSTVPAVEYEKDSNGNLIYDENGLLKYKKNTLKKNIEWKAVSFIDANSNFSIAKIGFQFVAPIIEFYGEVLDSTEASNIVVSKRSEDTGSDFLSRWDIQIPRGFKGDSVKSIRIVKRNEINNLKGDNIPEENIDIFVIDLIHYDKNNPKGILETYYIGEYNQIKNIKFEEGRFYITTGKGEEIFPPLTDSSLAFITEITFNEETRALNIKSNDTSKNVGPIILNSIDRILIDENDQELKVFYTALEKRGDDSVGDEFGWTSLGKITDRIEVIVASGGDAGNTIIPGIEEKMDTLSVGGILLSTKMIDFENRG